MTDQDTQASSSFRMAIAQIPISGDARINGKKIRERVREAAAGGARLIQFPEGALSGYAKNPIQDWAEVDWDIVREELEPLWRWLPIWKYGLSWDRLTH